MTGGLVGISWRSDHLKVMLLFGWCGGVEMLCRPLRDGVNWVLMRADAELISSSKNIIEGSWRIGTNLDLFEVVVVFVLMWRPPFIRSYSGKVQFIMKDAFECKFILSVNGSVSEIGFLVSIEDGL